MPKKKTVKVSSYKIRGHKVRAHTRSKPKKKR